MNVKGWYTHYIVISTRRDYEELKKYIIHLKGLEDSVGYFNSYLDFFERGYSLFGDNKFIDKDRDSIIYFKNDSKDIDIGWDKVYGDLRNYTHDMKEYKTAREWVLDIPEARMKLLMSETKLGNLL